jgi:hypothetical protein
MSFLSRPCEFRLQRKDIEKEKLAFAHNPSIAIADSPRRATIPGEGSRNRGSWEKKGDVYGQTSN